MTDTELTPQNLIWAYCRGIFPMASSRDGEVRWYSPDPRAILPLDEFHASQSLMRRYRSGRYRITTDKAFRQVITHCSGPRKDDGDTWINEEIIDSFDQLNQMGYAHSIESWLPTENPTGPRDDTNPEMDSNWRLVGGLYGLSLGGAFMGESMFSTETDASRVCLVYLVEHMRERGHTLLDVQFNNEHMQQFGVAEISRDDYLEKLSKALTQKVSWQDKTNPPKITDPKA
jgi:leucyl/phenylalanyl-tRNA--protein transferase